MRPLRFSLACCGVFILTSSVLALQLLEMRILSFTLWHHLAYMVISLVLLGLGAGGAFVAVCGHALGARRSWIIPLSAVMTGATTLVAFAILTRIELDTFELRVDQVINLVLYYAVLAAPFFFAGVSLSLLFSQGFGKITTLYAADMAGAAAGCYLFYLLIEPLGAERALCIVCVQTGLAGMLLAAALGGWRQFFVCGLATVLLAGSVPYSARIVAAQPAPSKSLARNLHARGARIVSTRWTPISRVDVLEAEDSTNDFLLTPRPGDEMKMITADGDANTWMHKNPDVLGPLSPISPEDYTDYHAAFLLTESPDSLIIGPGGGNEIYIAHAMGARRVVGVELNPAILDVSRRQFPQFAGNLYKAPNAKAVVSEGRSYIRHSGEMFDVIQMSGVDTWAGLSTGAYVLAENYLYTVNAVQDYYRHLKPDGIYSVARFRLNPPRESLRLVSNAFEALRREGVEHPEKHIVALSLGNPTFCRVLVKKSPFTPDEIETLRQAMTRSRSGGELLYAPDATRANDYQSLVTSLVNGDEEFFYRDYPYNVTPVYDDRPFFFEYYKWSRIWTDLANPGSGGQVGANKPIGLIILFSMLAQVSICAVAFILLPLFVFRRRGLTTKHPAAIVAYFCCLGLGYIFVEIGLMQRFVLFLSHPAYSIPVVLATLLVSSGVGSYVAPRFAFISYRTCILGIVALLGLLGLGLPILFDAFLGLAFAWRIAVTVLCLAPVGLVMGMPFPLGLAEVGRTGSGLIAWAWGINGIASVLGSILAVIIAMGAGFSVVFLSAGVCYLIALSTSRLLTAGSPPEKA